MRTPFSFSFSYFKKDKYLNDQAPYINGTMKWKKASLRMADWLAVVVIFGGCLGFIIWGIGISSIGNATLRWLGASIVALIGLIITFLQRWLK